MSTAGLGVIDRNVLMPHVESIPISMTENGRRARGGSALSARRLDAANAPADGSRESIGDYFLHCFIAIT